MSVPRQDGDAEARLAEIYRRVGEVHYRLASADAVDEELQGWCIERLATLLESLDDALPTRAGRATGRANRA